MVYKKYIKRGNKLYGPYKYHSRKVNGKVITDYLGKYEEKNKTLIFLIIGVLLFSLVFFALNYKNISSNWTIDLADSVSGIISSSLTSVKTIIGFAVSEEPTNIVSSTNETINETSTITDETLTDNKTPVNITLNVTEVTEAIEVNITNIATIQFQAVIGQPVKWKKHMELKEKEIEKNK